MKRSYSKKNYRGLLMKRDLKQELLVKDREHVPDNERVLNGYKSPIVDSNRLKENETQTTPVKHIPTTISPAPVMLEYC
ncbi:unnamed protein product [Callosobruchus maculatus]|uniref:Uncharacterized protein n=1 Tax=Callosobruchus maculatus TaxID=64391 RepID=A0A653DJ35_CALMS|nr:unnamed protein product [Callosobruchus maculatus]